ncbi:hypothetical protein PR202_ga20989 [Eleusine coracana subsp. coracana]|uniref:Dynamin-type G domain-containing protein n=1 Tax=Eleusine coracana subsp. coracana TaxID=191504 RepID=A0AAV5CYS2_ELECO|nr:hypothetical protein PR202_ga20989 [Eleusine coracana subsp. coracana]
MEALEELADATLQGTALLADDDPGTGRRGSSFLNVVAIGNVGAGKSAVLNGLVSHPVLPTGENGATRAPICVELQRDASLSTDSIILHIDSKTAGSLRRSLQDRLSKVGSSGTGRPDEISVKLGTCTAPPLKLIDLPGIDQQSMDELMISNYAAHNDAILLVIIPALQAPNVVSSRALRIARELDPEGTRTIGVLSKVDQAAREQKALGAVQALLVNQGPQTASDIQWVATIGHCITINSAQDEVGSETSLQTSERAEHDCLISILGGAPHSKLGQVALVETLAKQIRTRIQARLPNLLNSLQGKSQIVQEELAKLGEQMVKSSEGTRAIALGLCREFEDKFLQHIAGGEGVGWKVVASFEGKFPTRIKQLPLDKHFEMKNVKRIVLEVDGYQPYLVSPEKGLRSLIRGLLELAKEPSTLLVDEVHRVLLDIVSATANATPGLGRYAQFKHEVIAIASAALEGFKNEARKMVVALVDMERAFVPSQNFIRLVQRRMESQRHEYELKNRSTRKGQDADKKRLGYTKKQEERHFRGVINLEDYILHEILDDEDPPRSSKDNKNANAADFSKDPSLIFKITHKIAYKNVLKGHNVVILKAETMIDKTEWVTKIKSIVMSKGLATKRPNALEDDRQVSQINSDGSPETAVLKEPMDHDEELRWMSQEVRGYVEAVLNIDQAMVLCQVEKAKENMLNQLYTSISTQSIARIEELIQEDHNMKHKREKIQKQSSLLSKVTRLLSIHGSLPVTTAESCLTTSGPIGDEWKSAFDAGSPNSLARATTGNRRTPTRGLPPPPENDHR